MGRTKTKKIINLLDNTTDQPSKVKLKNWLEVNNNARGTYNINFQIKFKTIILISSLQIYLWKELKQLLGQEQMQQQD